MLLSGCLSGAGTEVGGKSYTTTLPLTNIQIYPVAASAAQGLSTHFSAMGTYSDGSSVDVTNQVTWVSANAGTATINSGNGIAIALTTGSVAIRASSSGIASNSATLTVTPAVLTSITITTLINGAGTVATFNTLNGITTDGTNLYVTETGNIYWTPGAWSTTAYGAIRQIVISSSVVSTLTITAGWSPAGITTDYTSLFVTDSLPDVHKHFRVAIDPFSLIAINSNDEQKFVYVALTAVEMKDAIDFPGIGENHLGASKNPWVKERLIPAARTLIGNYDGETSTEAAVTPMLKDGVDLLVERVGQEPKKN
jgi:hypothetical protein